jgi:hypothetical protein
MWGTELEAARIGRFAGACLAHKPWKKEQSLFFLILTPVHTEPFPVSV